MERTVLGIQVQSAREHFVIKLHTECKEKTPTKMQLFALLFTDYYSGLSWWLRRQTICPLCERCRFDSWVRRIPWRREWLPTPVFLPGEFHGQKSLAGYSSWGPKEMDTTEGLKQPNTARENLVSNLPFCSTFQIQAKGFYSSWQNILTFSCLHPP